MEELIAELAVATTIILLTVLRVLAYFERWGAGGSGGESD
jgi:hypothetical protein